jgi:hypothetical protein
VLNLIEADLVPPAVVELGRAGRGVMSDRRHLLQRAAVLQVRRDARGPEGVIADPGSDPGGPRPALNHRVGVGLGQGGSGELPGVAADGAEQRRGPVVRDAGAVEVGVEIVLERVVAGQVDDLAALSRRFTHSRRFWT